jgi:peroxiredoxin
MTDKTLLRPGDPFPGLIVNLPGGQSGHLPGDPAGRFGVVLFYRGAWCPYCNAHLSAFQRALDGLAEVDAAVLALSVDDEATTRDLITRHGLRFPVGHSADAAAVAEATGAFVNPTRPSCSRPASCWTPTAGSWAACTPAAPSGGSSRKTSSASSATCAKTPRPASPDERHRNPAPPARITYAAPPSTGLVRPVRGHPHLDGGARHRHNPAQQTGGASWHRYRITRTSPAGRSSSALLKTPKPDRERPA